MTTFTNGMRRTHISLHVEMIFPPVYRSFLPAYWVMLSRRACEEQVREAAKEQALKEPMRL